MSKKDQQQWIIGTGFSRGIGHEVLKIFKKNNYKILHLGRTKAGEEDDFVWWDLANQISDNPLNDLIKSLYGRSIAGFFYGAGLMPLLKLDERDKNAKRQFWQSQQECMRVNFHSCAELIEEILPFILETSYANKQTKFIAHMSSMAAVDPFPGFELYGAMKKSCLAYFKWMSSRYDAKTLSCLSLHPGIVQTDMLDDIIKNPTYKDMEVTQALKKAVTDKKSLSAQQAATNICNYLLKGEAEWTKGHGRLFLTDENKYFN